MILVEIQDVAWQCWLRERQLVDWMKSLVLQQEKGAQEIRSAIEWNLATSLKRNVDLAKYDHRRMPSHLALLEEIQ